MSVTSGKAPFLSVMLVPEGKYGQFIIKRWSPHSAKSNSILFRKNKLMLTNNPDIDNVLRFIVGQSHEILPSQYDIISQAVFVFPQTAYWEIPNPLELCLRTGTFNTVENMQRKFAAVVSAS
ncbi:hypothetical protein [Anaerolactibacter massiliensis]|uniref:hypothetical protein n=1 Tax=Anaerolactibacter massiliensis TaxID=2044573 RepID=UPI00107FD44D|nr:hypothetical protein [Anaerolactibacter massiliensis]